MLDSGVCLHVMALLGPKKRNANIFQCVALRWHSSTNKKMRLTGEPNVRDVIFFDVILMAKIMSHHTHCLITNIAFDTVD